MVFTDRVVTQKELTVLFFMINDKSKMPITRSFDIEFRPTQIIYISESAHLEGYQCPDIRCSDKRFIISDPS